jgi:Fis family transcriptional regulator, factor for inversion stimulation protein
VSTTLRSQLVSLVREMVERGIQYDDARKEFERAFVSIALEHANGTIHGAAEHIGMHRNTLSRKMAEYGIKTRNR